MFPIVRVFYHSVIHSLGFFICFIVTKTIKHAFSVLKSEKIWVCDQSEQVLDLLSVVILNNIVYTQINTTLTCELMHSLIIINISIKTKANINTT